MTHQGLRKGVLCFLGLLAIGWPGVALSADPAPRSREIREIRRAVKQLQEDREKDRVLIDKLVRRLDQVESENRDLKASNQQLQGQTTEQIKALETKVETGPPASAIQQALSGFWGEHRFVITGSAAGTFLYDRGTNINSFGAQFEPFFLYRLNDRVLFEGEIEAKLPAESESEFNLEGASAHIALTDNLEIQAGKFFLPFGDFIEDLHPFWVNRFVTNPLPFREQDDGGLVPFTDLGIQLRGGATWGSEGQDVDYSVVASNGPVFDEGLPTPVVGQMFNFPNNIATHSHSKAFGARVRVYPLPLDADWGRLEAGASTYDGKWEDGSWFTSWGLSAAYHLNEVELRGEYLRTHRQLPGVNADNREGWYVQAGYFLSRLGIPYLDRTEVLARYSGQNQRAIVADELPTVPAGGGGDVSLSQFVPHAREVALALNYFITPSVVWKLEYDVELPRSGGQLLTFGGGSVPVSTPASSPNDHAVITQLAIGF